MVRQRMTETDYCKQLSNTNPEKMRYMSENEMSNRTGLAASSFKHNIEDASVARDVEDTCYNRGMSIEISEVLKRIVYIYPL